MYLLSYQRKSDGKGTQAFLKLERQYFQDFFNDRSTEPHYHTKESLIKKVLKHFLSQSKDNASFKTSNQTYHRTKKISKKKTFETFLKLFKEQRFQVFRL